eukprot:scaffold38891_cov60-Phaeocystis_antarctica.AAC.3
MVWQRGQRAFRAVHAGEAARAHDLREVAGGAGPQVVATGTLAAARRGAGALRGEAVWQSAAAWWL